jgi:hypothetical protein
MGKRSDLIIFKNLNDTQLKRLINQLSHLKEYDNFLDYIYDPNIAIECGNKKFEINENVLINVGNLYGSVKKELEDINLPHNQIIGVIVDPMFVKENYLLVDISTPVATRRIEVYYNYISKIQII